MSLKPGRILLLICLISTAVCNSVIAQWNVQQLLRQGQSALYYDDQTQALEHFNQIIKVKPNLAEPYFFRGFSKLNLEDFNGAIADFTSAIDISPNYLDAFVYRGISYFQIGRYEEALVDYKEALTLAPGNAYVYAQRASTYAAIGEDALAEKDYSKAIKLNDKLQFAHLGRAIVRERNENLDGAIMDCNAVIRQNIFSDVAFGMRGTLYKKKGDIFNAMEDYNMAIKANPNNIVARMNRALVWYEMKNYDETMSEFGNVLAIDSSYIYAWYNRALLNMELGAYNDAIKDFDKVSELNSQNIIVYFNRALAYKEIGDNRRAYRDLSESINLYPDFVKAYFLRASVLDEMNRSDEADKDRYVASSIMDRYKRMKGGAADALVDTTDNFKRLLDINDQSNYARRMLGNRVQDRTVAVRLKGLDFVCAVPKDSISSSGVACYEPAVVAYNSRNMGCIQLGMSDSIFNASFVVTNEEQDDRLLIQGILNLNAGNYMEAIELFGKVSKTSDVYGLAVFCRANARVRMFEYIESLRKSSSVMYNEDSDRRVDYSQVLEDYDECLRIYSNFKYALYNKATILAEGGSIDQAIELYGQLIIMNSDMAKAYFNRGILYLYIGKKRQAAEDLGKAGELGLTESYNIIKRYCTDV